MYNKYTMFYKDILISISDFLSTHDLISLSSTCRDYRIILLFDIHVMSIHKFTLSKTYTSLEFIKELPYKIYNLDLNTNKNIKDKDFQYIKGIHTLDMSGCNQDTITDNAFKYLKGIYTLNIKGCKQITDKAFENLKGIHTLDMSWCNKKTITDKAFVNLKGIHTVNMYLCKQITDKAFSNALSVIVFLLHRLISRV